MTLALHGEECIAHFTCWGTSLEEVYTETTGVESREGMAMKIMLTDRFVCMLNTELEPLRR